ncbi:MAG: N-ethylammeline chlorohydrolase [Oceanospirillaceae bacterium]|jgi:5-methylthioadenosine/S-adenosylhomocysteine deaminase|uniref:TRZ/ATZ family hydrolase n=1 Tax=unclassified Thalassolituus TaxID=2624967 RepID=UPI000C0DFA7F|nr:MULTISPECIES: TRZ/ATZ family hydrolase [unclassified Thalassolituus]MAE35729.1 N-ethylammeline chlorohydrolase [Oceanospirillaceae bacterium]MBN59290.1 N-ethylammeline chlorohydrolase [Oceanospirillaceae bacterium]MDQ4423517.1 TRZ/ATZ family hydrolase [Thalassolituus sp.]MDQ4426436.1 TRZ/ATZ family hydrolase [Thalassolituus sp.]|tara:strand:+ start:228 stop:1532 length:1305 start_codon:yes stop_codon:yes gene_type:complete
MQADLRIDARWVLPLGDNNEVFENYSVYITDGRIVGLQPQSELGPEVKEHIKLEEHVLLPGYINAHGHAAMSLFRGLADDRPLMTWLQDHIWPAEAQWVSGDFVYQGTQLAIAEMLRCGTTTFADMYFYSGDSIEAAIDAGIRTVSLTPVLDFPTNFAQNADEYIRKTLDVHSKYRHQPLAHVGIGPHAPYTVSDEPLKEIATTASQLQMPVQIHLHETGFEVSQSIEERGMRPTQRLAELGFLNESVSCVHMTQIDEIDIDILRQTGASVVHCPESNLKLASGFCPVGTLLNEGVNVGIGTDGAASNNDLNIQGEMKTAAMLAKAVANDAASLPAMAALKMATIGSARALGIDELTGSIELNKYADLQAVRMSELTQSPMYDPASQLVYTDSSRYTEYVWVAGKARLSKGELTSIDASQILENTRLWQSKIYP